MTRPDPGMTGVIPPPPRNPGIAHRTSKFNYFIYTVLAVAVLSVIVAVFIAALGGSPYDNKDPRVGRVWINDNTWKQCDGTTLVYSGHRPVILNSEQCVR